jgi:hypothetical protein
MELKEVINSLEGYRDTIMMNNDLSRWKILDFEELPPEEQTAKRKYTAYSQALQILKQVKDL